MRFHLNYTPAPANFKIQHSHKCFLIGSCFSEHIGTKLKEHGFQVLSNTTGILFNPISISQQLTFLLNPYNTAQEAFLLRDKHWYSFLHHSSVHANSELGLRKIIQNEQLINETFLKSSQYLFITFGTAYSYYHTDLKLTVANCHKQPAVVFKKQLAEPDTIVNAFLPLLKSLHGINPELQIIFTVSPVKHLRDGIIENNISKSSLVLAVHKLVNLLTYCSYFPAFELVNDDLRDYRFYKEDMAHPNEQAIQYVWQKFSERYFSPDTLALNRQIADYQRALKHKKIQENNGAHQQLEDFLTAQYKAILKLHPFLSQTLPSPSP